MAILSKKANAFAYGMGGAVVIVGALFKITHFEIGPLTGTLMLSFGLITEALIFAISAFEPVEHELDWALVFPELAGGQPRSGMGGRGGETESEGLLSQKLDILLREAKIDGELVSSLGSSIRNFESVARVIVPTTVDSIASTKKYNEELSVAAGQMESLNSLYRVQLEDAFRNVEANRGIIENTDRLKEQLQYMTSNIASLNNVYGGMLSAMNYTMNNKG